MLILELVLMIMNIKEQEIINLKNGVYNIKTDEFCEHSPTYYLTQEIPLRYNHDAKINQIESVDDARREIDLILEANLK